MKKCLPDLKIFTIFLAFVLAVTMVNAQKTALSSTAWSLPTTWSPLGVPSATDAVTIPSGITVSMDAASGACASLTINANAVGTNGLTISGTNTLTVGGNVTLNQPTVGTSTLAVSAGTLTANGTISIPGSATVGRNAIVSVSTGTINCDAVTFSGTAAQAKLTFTGAGTLKVGNGTTGTLGTGGTLTMFALNTINYDGIAQTVRPMTYNNLVLSGSGVKTTTGVTVNDKLSMQGSATAGNIITYSSAILEYKGSAPQTTSVNEFPAAMATDVIIDNASGVTLDAGKTLSGDLTLTSGTLIAGTSLTISSSGTPLITRSGGDMTGTIQGTFDYNVTYTGISKTTDAELSGSGFADINVNLTAGQTLTLDQNRVPDDVVTIATGTFDLGGFTLNNSGTNALTVSNGAKLIIGGTNGLPSGYNYAFAATSTVEYAGANQAVGSTTYGHLIVSGSGTKTVGIASATTINGDLSIGSGITFTVGAAAITVDGTTTIDGTLTVTSTTAAKSFDNMIIKSGGSFNSSVNEDYTMTGDLQIDASGSITAGTGIYTWTASGAFSGTATLTSVVVSGTGAVVLTNNGTLTTNSLTGADGLTQGATGVLNYGGTGGATFNVATFVASAVGNTVNYTAAAQTIRGVAYSNLTLSGSLAKTLGAATTVNGTLSMRGTASLALGAFALTYGAASTLEYAGSTAQTTANTEFKTPGGPLNLKINNSNGVTLHAARTINGNLDLASGILTTTALNLLTINTNGTVVPEASNSSFVSGPISKTGTAAFKFPVGKTGSGYVPVEIGTAAGSNTFTAEYNRGVPPNNANITAPGINHISACDYWTLNRSAGSDAVDVTLYWNSNNPCSGSSYVQDPSGIKAVHYNGVSWDDASPGVGTGTASDGSVTWTAHNTFSPFALGAVIGSNNPLPVMFADVKAFEKNTGVQIEWSNLTERDLIKYVVERSANGVNFTAIDQQLPRSNQNDKENYSAFDATPFTGANYYRIKVLEISGKIIYSKILKVEIGKTKSGFTLYPNPVTGNQVTIGINAKQGQYTIKVLNTAGQNVYSQGITHLGGSMARTIELPSTVKPGVYNMQISGDNYSGSKMFIVQ